MRLKYELELKSPELLIEEFISLLDEKRLVSSLTGSVYLSPIRINGSSEPQERGFIENAIKTNGENPLTKEPMTLEEIAKVPDDENTLKAINHLTNQFLEDNASHPELDKIKALLSKEIYQSEPLELNNNTQGTTNASADDMLAIQQIQGNRPTLHPVIVAAQITFFQHAPLFMNLNAFLPANTLRTANVRRV